MDIRMELPRKGKDIIATLDDGSTVNVFRCNCRNPNCKEFRCSTTGFSMDINVVTWVYKK